LNGRDPRREKRRIEGITATSWGIKEGISCGGLGDKPSYLALDVREGIER